MRVKFLTSVAGPRFEAQVDDVRDIPDDLALRLIDKKAAVRADSTEPILPRQAEAAAVTPAAKRVAARPR